MAGAFKKATNLSLLFLGLLLFCQSSIAQNCYNSNDDENCIEYFNLINFMSDIEIKVSSKNEDTYDISILCPEKMSPTIPPPNLQILLKTASSNLETQCYSTTPLTIAQTDPNCIGGECTLKVIASNTSTQKVYSETLLKVVLHNDLILAPELNPASLPICLSSITPCLTQASCSLATSSAPHLSNTHDQYNYNETIYFNINDLL